MTQEIEPIFHTWLIWNLLEWPTHCFQPYRHPVLFNELHWSEKNKINSIKLRKIYHFKRNGSSVFTYNYFFQLFFSNKMLMQLQYIFNTWNHTLKFCWKCPIYHLNQGKEIKVSFVKDVTQGRVKGLEEWEKNISHTDCAVLNLMFYSELGRDQT